MFQGPSIKWQGHSDYVRFRGSQMCTLHFKRWWRSPSGWQLTAARMMDSRRKRSDKEKTTYTRSTSLKSCAWLRVEPSPPVARQPQYAARNTNSYKQPQHFPVNNNNNNNNITHDSRETAFLFQRLSVAIQRFNSVLIQETFDFSDGQPDL